MIEKAILTVIVGVLVGLVNSIAGGGVLIGFPLLLYFGLTAIVSNATMNAVALAGQLTASFGYRKELKDVPRGYFGLIIPSLVGGVIGALVLRHTSNNRFLVIAPALILLAVVLFAFQPYIKQRLYQAPERISSKDRPSVSIYLLAFLLAIYGGYFGAGYGLIMLAILSLTRLNSILKMNGLKNVYAAVICFSAVVILFNSHLINWRYGLSMAIGTAIGGYIGAYLAPKLPLTIIRYIVMLIGLATAIYLYTQAHIT